jgi:septum formation protein
MNQARIHLASASPRRAELLRQIGVQFSVHPVTIDEARRADETPLEFVCRIASEKAAAAWCGLGSQADRHVLAADTAVVLGGEVFGKPRDREDCISMLGRLSGQVHDVLTAVTLQGVHGATTRCSQSRVRFRDISDRERLAYWESGEPADKAGGYAIQGLGAVFVTRLEGSYSGVMGLPLYETASMLQARGLFAIAVADQKENA